jgi:hypothetical protein
MALEFGQEDVRVEVDVAVLVASANAAHAA